MLAVATIIIAAHPINKGGALPAVLALGPLDVSPAGRDVPYVSDQEWVTLGLTAAAVGGAVWLIW